MTPSPHDLLPLAAPCEEEFKSDKGFFYENVAKPLIVDTIRIMSNGLPIDLKRVQELEKKLDELLEVVHSTIANNACIKEFQDYKFPIVAAEVKAEIYSKMKPPSHWQRDFKCDDPIHRSYYMHLYAKDKADIVYPIKQLGTGIAQWDANYVKKLAKVHKDLEPLVNKTLPQSNRLARDAIKLFCKHKSELYNKSYLDQIAQVKRETVMQPFNPGSAPQKSEFFEWLGIEPVEFSKETGNPSWGRKVIEELLSTEQDPDIREIYQAFIDFSFASIVRNNFIEAFYNYTVDGKLYGNYRLLGTKTGRFTSNQPNMLNSPSTGSIYAKPIKRCFTAPPGYLIWSIDYAA